MSSRDAIARNTVAAEVTSDSIIYVRVKMSKNDFLRQIPMFLSMFRWIIDFVFWKKKVVSWELFLNTCLYDVQKCQLSNLAFAFFTTLIKWASRPLMKRNENKSARKHTETTRPHPTLQWDRSRLEYNAIGAARPPAQAIRDTFWVGCCALATDEHASTRRSKMFRKRKTCWNHETAKIPKEKIRKIDKKRKRLPNRRKWCY